MRYSPSGLRRGGTAVAVASIALLTVSSACTSTLERRFQNHIDYLASDRLEGRGVGSHGIELAGDYIAREFTKIGLQPAGENGTCFQTFDMTLHRTLTGAARLAFAGDREAARQGRFAAPPIGAKLGVDFIPLSFSSDEAFDGDVVFCGYGIHSPDRDRDDFVHVDLTGKVAMMLRGEPPSWADEEGATTPHAMFRNKVYNAKDRGAVAVLIVNQAPPESDRQAARQGRSAAPPDELIEFEGHGSDAYGIPAFHITRAIAEAQLARGGGGSLQDLQERMDAGSYVSTTLETVRASGQAGFEKKSTPTRNVLAVLPGHGALAHEYIVVGAHYDHLGLRKPMARTFKKGLLVKATGGPQIHNGADDNASGTSGIIEIARLLAEGPPLKRSVLFIAFTAEESGLHGSKHFVEQPTVALDDITAMLNLDMVGRMKPGSDTVQIFGVESAAAFSPIVARAAEAVGLSTAPSLDSGGRSDHASFLRRDIPSMHFFTGQHRDYHKPSDDSHKINARDGARVTSLIAQIASELATSDSRPTFREIEPSKSPDAGGTPVYRVVMGLSPGYGDDGKPGMAVEDVSPDGPADLAGMKPGDRIIRIDAKKVANVYDYMAAMRNNKPGDVVEVVVLRDGTEHTLNVTLSAAG